MRVDDIAEKFGDKVKIEWMSFMLRTEPKTSSHEKFVQYTNCLLYTSPSPRDATLSRMPSSA